MTPEERAVRIKAYDDAAQLREDLAAAKPRDPKSQDLLKFAKELRDLASQLRAEGVDLTETAGSA